MLSIDFKEANFTFTKPQGWTDEQCSDLRVWKGNVPIDDSGATAPTIISCWRLSKEDLEEIQLNGGTVWLYITGTRMPPVSLATEHPFTEQPAEQ